MDSCTNLAVFPWIHTNSNVPTFSPIAAPLVLDDPCIFSPADQQHGVVDWIRRSALPDSSRVELPVFGTDCDGNRPTHEDVLDLGVIDVVEGLSRLVGDLFVGETGQADGTRSVGVRTVWVFVLIGRSVLQYLINCSLNETSLAIAVVGTS